MPDEPLVTPEHLLGFGGIIHHYAFVEVGIKIAAARVAGIALVDFMILSEPYSSLDLRNVSKSLAKTHEPISKNAERFLQLVGDFATFSKVRNWIAHCRWKEGQRAGSIKPFGVDIRDGKARVIGDNEKDADWTADDLYEIANQISALAARISAFLTETGPA